MKKKKVFISIMSILLAICITLVTIHFVTYRKRSFAEITNNLCDEVDYVVYEYGGKIENQKLNYENSIKFVNTLKEANYTLDKGEKGCALPDYFKFYNSQQQHLFTLNIIVNTQMCISIGDVERVYSVDGWEYDSYNCFM